MITQIIGTIGLSLLSGKFYRMGGTGGAWYLNTKIRDMLVPLCGLGVLYLWGFRAPWWIWGSCFGLAMASMTTYWDWLTKFWRGDDSEYWENWLLTGLGYGMAMLPMAWYTDHWWGLATRTLFLGLTTMVWSQLISSDELEEKGRGILYTVTIPLMMI